MKTKHTPGQWEAIPYDPNLGKDYEGKWWVRGPADAEGWRTVADVAKYGDEAEANASLIAAAPELLSMLRTLVEVPEVHSEHMQAARELLSRFD